MRRDEGGQEGGNMRDDDGRQGMIVRGGRRGYEGDEGRAERVMRGNDGRKASTGEERNCWPRLRTPS